MRSTSITVVLVQAISSCLSTLAQIAKTRYFVKILLFGLTASEDPCEIWKKGKFEEDIMAVASSFEVVRPKGVI